MRCPRLLAALLACGAPVCLAPPPLQAAGPAFVPKPSDVYEGFVAINGPRAEVPVGALWIDGYGPHGETAAADNLETVRGLSGITINRDLELKLTAGLLDLLGIDPGLRRQFQARFTDISIVRVKDVARLSGPAGEPRIIEAMKAGSILVTTDRQVGLDLDKRSLNKPVVTRLDSNGRSAFSIEGRDMFIAMRVAKVSVSRSEPRLVRFQGRKNGSFVAEEDGLKLQLQVTPCEPEPTTSNCTKAAAWRLQAADPEATQSKNSSAFEPRIKLPVPRADEHGGLYTHAELVPIAPCRQQKERGCGSDWRGWLTLSGERTVDLERPEAPRW